MSSLFQLNIDRLAWELQVRKPVSFAERIAQLQAPHQALVEDPIKKIIQETIAASCTIIVHSPDGEWTGSGFHIGDGLIGTAAHVATQELMKQPHALQVTFDGKTLYEGQVVASEPNYDCALIYSPKIVSTIIPVLLADSDKVEIGDIIAVIGSPLGFHDTATVGHVANIHQGLGNQAPTPAWKNDLIIIDADIQQGASGGMCILTSGEVIGNVMGVTGDHADLGVGERMICPSNKIRKLLETLIK